MRRVLFMITALILLPALSRADDVRFYSHGWADSSGKDGKGGVSIVCVGDKHNFLLRPDFSKDKIDSKASFDHPDWIIHDSDSNDGNCISYEFTWVTTPSDKFWGRKWAGGGLAFDNSWATHNLSTAKYLVFSARTNSPGVDFNIALTGATDSEQTGNVKMSDFAEGHQIGETWTKVIIPLASFPSLSKVDLTKVKTLRFDLAGDYPENKLVFVHFDKMYFTETALVTPVENLGWLRVPGALEFVWDKSNDDGITGYTIRVDGRVAGVVPKGRNKRVKLLTGWFKGTGSHVVDVAATNGKQNSSFSAVTVTGIPPASAEASVSLAAAPGHAISPYLWGFNYLDSETLKKAGASVNRWGGNDTTGYNWQDDADNHGADWTYLNSGGPIGIAEKDKRYYKFVEDTLAGGATPIITIPITGWVAKAPPKDGPKFGSFPLSLFPGQKSGQEPGLGTGDFPDGKKVWGNDPNYNYLPSTPQFQSEWVKALIQDFGSAAKGGVRFYQMDNEPGLWNENHRDVMPKGIGYDGLADLNAKYAAMVKAADPDAKVIGMVAWGAMELAGSAWDYMPGGVVGYKKEGTGEKWTDRKAHGDLPQVAWFLKEMNRRSQLAGKRLLDYLDDHGFPEVWGKDAKGNKVNVLGQDCDYDPVITPQQFEAMRIFWDPTFESPDSWCANTDNKPYLWDPFVGLIPKLKQMIAEYYPGTKLSMTEYYPACSHHYPGGLLEAVNLGIFMREGMDMACDWGSTWEGNYVFFGHRLYSNYDGNGSKVGGNYVASTSSSPDLYSFAAQNGSKTFVVLVNRNHDTAQDTTLALAKPVTDFETYTLTESAGKRLFDSGPQAASGSSIKLEVPAFSALLLVAQ